jgi:ATP-binding cassette subfamily F protein uup
MARNDRIGIVGPNGCGKSTFLNIICGRIKADSGRVEVGETVKIGLYTQEIQHMDGSLRAIEYIKEGAEYLNTAEGYKISASQMMERFLFSPSLQWSPIGKLSGGERRRVDLLRVLMESPNVLLLDEPPNDLDIETLTILEDYLEDFEGAVIAVSHDRYFLDRIAEKIFAFEGNGKITQYTGNYSDYREKSAQNREEAALAAEKSNLKAVDINKPEIQKKKPLKFTFKEQREFEEIDDIIAEIEDKIACVGDRINHAASDYTLLQELLKEKEGLEKQLEEKMDRWVYLNELAEKIEMEK